MGKMIANISMSLDGLIAGPKDGGQPGKELEALDSLHAWLFPPIGNTQEIQAEMFKNVGAVIMGNRMFTLGEEPWGGNPPFHMPVFVLAHRPRPDLVMEGGTTFTFVTDGIESALRQAQAAAGGRDVMVMGGADAIQQYLNAGLLDEIHLHIVPVLLGEGIRLFDNMDAGRIELEKISVEDTPDVTHFRFRVVR